MKLRLWRIKNPVWNEGTSIMQANDTVSFRQDGIYSHVFEAWLTMMNSLYGINKPHAIFYFYISQITSLNCTFVSKLKMVCKLWIYSLLNDSCSMYTTELFHFYYAQHFRTNSKLCVVLLISLRK